MFKRVAFQKKLFISYSIVVTLIILCSVFAFYQYIIKTTEGEAVKNLEQLAVKTSDQVDTFFKTMDQMALQGTTNPALIPIMRDMNESDPGINDFEYNLETAQEMTSILLSINGPSLSASRISVYNLRGDYISFGRLSESRDRISEYLRSDLLLAKYTKLDSLKGKRLIIAPHADVWSNNEDIRIVSLLRMIKSLPLEKNYGIVEVQQPYEMLAGLLEVHDLKAILFSESGEILASSVQEDNEMKRYFDHASPATVHERIARDMDNDNEEVIVAVRSKFTNQLLVLVQPRNELFATQRIALRILFLSGISLVIVTLVITFVISQSLTKPLRQLRKSMKHVTLSNLSIEFDQTSSANEFTLLNRAFDAMFRRLNESISQEIKAHLLALQSQMNPHFL